MRSEVRGLAVPGAEQSVCDGVGATELRLYARQIDVR